MLLYTDGITEAMDEKGKQFGTERMSSTLTEYYGAPVEEIRDRLLDNVMKWTADQADDISWWSSGMSASREQSKSRPHERRRRGSRLPRKEELEGDREPRRPRPLVVREARKASTWRLLPGS